jgi:hypothetical protein
MKLRRPTAAETKRLVIIALVVIVVGYTAMILIGVEM